jgi:putative ABC transport system permease protein
MAHRDRWSRNLRFFGANVDAEVDADVDDELRFHLDMLARDFEARGLPPDAAARAALDRFGDYETVNSHLRHHDHDRVRTQHRRDLMDDLKQDIRYALRNLRRAPLFALVVIATLALGIGANTAVFSIVDAVMLRPLPYAAPEQLTAIYGNTLADFTRIRELTTSWSDVAIYQQTSVGLSGEQEPAPERVDAANVSPNFFSTLGVRAAIGRDIGDDASTGQPNVVVISAGLWRRRFGADRAIVGKSLAIEGTPFVIVGVASDDFTFPRRGTDLWFPIVMPPSRSGAFWGSGGYGAVGRLRAGVTAGAAQKELRSVYPRIALENPIWHPGPKYGADATVVPLQQKLAGPARTTLLLLLGAVGVVLLISCANVANLLLVRATSRRKEIAIRMAIGGGRGRLVRQLVTESVVLAVLGGVAGAGVAWLGVHELVRVLPSEVARVADATIDIRVLSFALFLVVIAGFAFGIIPALRATQADVQPTLRDGSRTSTGSHRRALAAVVSAEIAAAVLLITGALLLIRTMSALAAIDPGFRVESLVTARVAPPIARFADPQKSRAFFDELIQRLGELPGVERVAASTHLPLAAPSGGLAIRIQGQFEEIGPALPVTDHYELVTPGYLETMRIPVVAGRDITTDDRADSPPVTLISESLARHYWPAGDALGKHVNYPWKSDWITIVGIVKDAKLDSLTGQHEETLYRPIAQAPAGLAPITALSIVMRTSRDPATLARSLRQTVAQIDPATPVSNIETMQDIVERSAARQRFTARLFSLFAAIALLLGVVGIYGVMSYAVAQRQREIGVRMALGASPLDAQRLVLGEGLRLAGVGIAVGIVLSLVATRLLGTMLYGVTPTDPLTFAIVPVLLAGVALLASYLPARRATRIDPTTALRAD